MKLFKKAMVVSLMMIASQAAVAVTVFTDAVLVSSVIPSAAGNVIVGATVTTNANPASCPNAGFLLSASDAGFKNMYATVLTALASGGTVSFGIDNANCAGGFPVIQGLIATPAA